MSGIDAKARQRTYGEEVDADLRTYLRTFLQEDEIIDAEEALYALTGAIYQYNTEHGTTYNPENTAELFIETWMEN